jgi:hypothetical protein
MKLKILIQKLWEEKPLSLILLAGLFFRLLAAFFSKGYGMSDDHFLVIEVSQSWIDEAKTNWLPADVSKPSGHSFFYPGLHFLLFSFLKWLGITNPEIKMFVVRLLHAFYSLITVYFGYRIAEKITDKKAAKTIGLLLSLYFFMPFLSVRNLVEVTCIPPLVYATWLLLNNGNKKISAALWAGIVLGIAFSIRFQTILFTGGVGLALLFKREIWRALMVGLGFLIAAGLVQGFIDYSIWGKPFVEMQEYINYNILNANNYITQSWYNYFILLFGILVPPLSIALLFGYFKSARKQLLLFLPSFVFLVFHSYFPNKQERFILPIIPFIIILGYAGWWQFATQSGYWKLRQHVIRGCWIFFWILNCIALVFVSVAYSKRSRVESMIFLSKQTDLKNFIMEDSNREGSPLAPRFYLNKWCNYFCVTKVNSAAEVKENCNVLPDKDKPNYVIFIDNTNIDARLAEFRKSFPYLIFMTEVEPSFMDKFMHTINPQGNKNQTCYIYKIL